MAQADEITPRVAWPAPQAAAVVAGPRTLCYISPRFVRGAVAVANLPGSERVGRQSQMECTDVRASGEFLLIARRNNSLSATGRALVLGSLVLITLAISLAFALFGAWLMLPFAGAEVGVLCIAFCYMQRHAADFESLAIKGDRVLVERWDRGKMSRYELNRCWAQVVLHRGDVPGR